MPVENSMQSASFDNAAVSYDSEFTNSNIGIRTRALVWKHLLPIININKEMRILELNCGTGEDAITFASLGYQITATDISTEMIKVAGKKNNNEYSNLKFVVADIREISLFIKGKYDLVFSNFGGLNCLSSGELESLSSQLSLLLNKNGKFVAVVMPEFCLWESIYFLAKLSKSKAIRRFANKQAYAEIEGVSFPVYYFSPRRFVNIFKNNFSYENSKPIGFALPPGYMEKFFLSKLTILNILEKIEYILSRFRFLANFSDHYFIELSKKEHAENIN